MNILYIHGLGGNKEGASGQYIKAFFEQSGNHQVHLETFDLVSIESTINQIKELLKIWRIDCIMATSLGAFYALLFQESHRIILTNPCMLPSIEIPKLTPLHSETIQEFQKLENRLYSDEGNHCTRQIFAAFADGDELFSYRDFFLRHYPDCPVISFPGNHQLSKEALQKVLDESNKFVTQISIR